MQNRIYDAVYDIYSKNAGKTVCIVFHGTAIKAFLCRLKGFCLNQMIDVGWCDNTGVTIIDFETWENPKFVLEADVSHLPRELSTFERQGNWHKDPTLPLSYDQK
ncbi:hypothetical protein SDC9_116617 [bioreactor metagenome]|uniref:2,3-bisphosphoglycerate-dependent phosphoglycerate mutase n=1 Tax=bioreactor metagenome TaxID=1076179 RepID=A0A645BW75_9ZZZZ